MADLDTFDDRTIKRARDKFTNGKRGSGDDPIATHAKVAQDVMLGHLRALIARAENKADATRAGLQGEIDGDSLIDPFLSYDENVAEIQDEFGVTFRTYAEKQRKGQLQDADEKARRHARETLRERFDEIEAGEADGLVQDVADDFGQDFVAEVLGRERDIRKTPEPERAPEPTVEEPATTDPEPVEPAKPPTSEPAKPAQSVATGRFEGISSLLMSFALFAQIWLHHTKADLATAGRAVRDVAGQVRRDAETVVLSLELLARKRARAVHTEAHQ